MRNKVTLFIVLSTVFTVVALARLPKPIVSATENTTTQSAINTKPSKDNAQPEIPVVDYNAAEDPDPVKRAKRKLKNSRYDDKRLVRRNPADNIAEAVRVSEQPPLAALPAVESSDVVVGEVVDSQAHLSNDKTGVYSEFTVRVTEVLKSRTSIPVGGSITAERVGGVVKHTPTNSRVYRIQGQNSPRVGRRYVLFLDTLGQDQGFSIVTSYELKNGKVVPLDDGYPFSEYADVDEATFMRAVLESLSRS